MSAGQPCEQRRCANPELRSAEPAAGAPQRLAQPRKITFKRAVIPQFSGADVKDQAGKTIATGKAAVDPANRKAVGGGR